MQVRWLSVRGMPIIEDEAHSTVGLLLDVLIEADTGVILGFFVGSLQSFTAEPLFLSTLDIVSWGTKIHVRNISRLAPASEFIRLQKYLEDSRSFIGQKMYIEQTKKCLGKCIDVQFDTRHFHIQWLFPRRLFFFLGQPVAASEIVEVTEKGIWIADPLKNIKEPIAAENTQVVETPPLSDITPAT